MTLLPLLAGCTAAYLVSALGMRHSIMTEKIARRGGRVVSDYAADLFEQVNVSDVASAPVVTLQAKESCENVREWILKRSEGSGHRGFPVVDGEQRIVGVVTRRDLFDASATGIVRDLVKRSPAIVFENSSLRDATDHMVREGVSLLPVVSRSNLGRVVGIVTRADIVAAYARRLDAERRSEPRYRVPGRWAVNRQPGVEPATPGSDS
jgi:predicted transcriptional regulator